MNKTFKNKQSNEGLIFFKKSNGDGGKSYGDKVMLV